MFKLIDRRLATTDLRDLMRVDVDLVKVVITSSKFFILFVPFTTSFVVCFTSSLNAKKLSEGDIPLF